MPARLRYLSPSRNPRSPTSTNSAPAHWQSRAMLPVFWGMRGSTSTTVSSLVLARIVFGGGKDGGIGRIGEQLFRPQHHAGEGIVGNMHGDLDLLGNQLVHTGQQGPAARQHDAPVHDVRR